MTFSKNEEKNSKITLKHPKTINSKHSKSNVRRPQIKKSSESKVQLELKIIQNGTFKKCHNIKDYPKTPKNQKLKKSRSHV